MLFEFVVGKFANILTEKNEAKNALLSTTYERSLYGGNGSFCKLMIFARFIFLRMKENTQQSEEERKMIVYCTVVHTYTLGMSRKKFVGFDFLPREAVGSDT